MKLAVFSDTHSNIGYCIHALKEHPVDAVVHLGDYDRDALALAKAFPSLPLYSVCGNCDISPTSPRQLLVDLDGVKALLVHGHEHRVDRDISSLVYAAQELGAGLALYGHTHRPLQEELGGVRVINPGTSGFGPRLSWCLVEIMEGGGIGCTFFHKDLI